VRLEAILALAKIPSPQSVVVATKALDKSIDPFIDYALWLTCTELEPIWLPAYQSGSLTGWEKPEQLGYALRAVKSPAAVKNLIAQLSDPKTTPAARAGMVQLLGSIGEPGDANNLLNLALSPQAGEARTSLLAALIRLAEDRHIRPTQQPDRIAALLSEPSTCAQAIILAGDWKLEMLRPQIEKIAEATESDAPPRLYQLAMLTLGNLGREQSRQVLDKLSGPSQRPDVRQAAIHGLLLVDPNKAAKKAAEMLAAGPGDPSSLIAAFSAREGGAQALADALTKVSLPKDTARLALRSLRSLTTQDSALSQVLSSAAGTSGAPIKLNPEQMKQAVDEVLAKGDAARGEQVFRRSESSCYLCHAIDGAGGWLAPDLSSIGASSPVDYLINSVLDPNKDIKDGFDGYSVVTKSGEVYSGIKVNQDNNRIVLRDNAHYEIPIPLADIKEQKSIGSLMPNGLSDTMTHQELLDLIKFLSQLGKPGPYASSPAQYIRRWRVVGPIPYKSSPPLAENEGAPAYSLVSGFLPGDALRPSGTGTLYVCGQINVTAAGKIGLVPNDSRGLKLWVDDKPEPVGAQITLDLPAGVHTLMFEVDPSPQTEGLRIEVTDVPGSSAHAQPVGGK
jgi:putative heme-binding domain-containing protein